MRKIIVISKEFKNHWDKKVAEVKKCVTDAELEANANLIVDAFKVRKQINCELSELLEQNNEMLNALQEIVCMRKINIHAVEFPIWKLEQLEQLIKKVKDNE